MTDFAKYESKLLSYRDICVPYYLLPISLRLCY